MKTCYYLCDENTPNAQKLRIWDNRNDEYIWIVEGECPEPLYTVLSEEADEWVIEEYYTEDDDHGDAFRYFHKETNHYDVTVETAIVKDGTFAGALYRNKADGSQVPVLTGRRNVYLASEWLNSTHTLEKQSSAKLIRKSDADKG